jgi:hypothetical protein
MFQNSLLHPRPEWVPAALEVIARHEFLAAAQIAGRLALDHDLVEHTLVALADDGLLRALRLPEHPGTSARIVYALARGGAELLHAAGRSLAQTPSIRHTTHHLAHEAEKADLGLALERLADDGTLRLLRFETRAAALADATLVLARGYLRRVPLVADALAVVETVGRVAALLVEHDRATVPIRRMRTQYAGFVTWWKCGGPEKRFGIRSLRVLTVCPTPARLRALRAAAILVAGTGGTRFLWFVLAEHVNPARPHALFEPHAELAVPDAPPVPLLRA